MSEKSAAAQVKEGADFKQLRIALFGESGCGKTTLLGSYYGKQQSEAFKHNNDYSLETKKIEQSHELLRIYYALKDDNKFPRGSVDSRKYNFNFMVRGIKNPAFEIEIIDYPGMWWTKDAVDEEERLERIACLNALLESHIGILLVDADRYIKEKGPYLQQLLAHFRGQINRLTREMNTEQRVPIEHWIIGLNKAGLMPSNYTARQFREDVIRYAGDELREFQLSLKEGAPQVDIGNRYLLISSVHITSNGNVDVERTKGLELIAPATAKTMLDHVHLKAKKELKDAEKTPWPIWLKRAILSLRAVSKYLDKQYKGSEVIIELLQSVASSVADKAEDEWQKRKKAAISKGDAIEAAVLTMHAYLAGHAGNAFYFSEEPDEKPAEENQEKQSET